MTNQNDNTEKLFSYGTLRYESVQLATFGRLLKGTPDILSGFNLSMLEIKDSDVIKKSGEAAHPILKYTGNQQDQVTGFVFEITSDELKQADLYEVDDYKRISVQLNSGIDAWVYVAASS